MNPNTGHGHVRPRSDGVRARCGGPALCPVCQREQAARTDRYPNRTAEAEEFWRQVDAGLIPRPPRTVHRPEGA